jgi:hypothetical protein
METATDKQNSREIISREILIVANCEEPIVGIPVIVEPVKIEVTLRIVLVEISHVALAIHLHD